MKSEGYPQELVSSENYAISYDLVFTALGKDAFFEREYLDRFEGISLVNYYIYSQLILIVMYVGVFAGLSHLREKLGSVHLRLETIGYNRFPMIMSKAFAYTLVCGSMLILTVVAIDLSAKLNIGVLPLIYLVIALFLASLLFIIISRCFSSEGSFIIFANMLVLLLTIAGGGIINIARFSPNYWFIRGLV